MWCTIRFSADSRTPVCGPTDVIDIVKENRVWEKERHDCTINGVDCYVFVTKYQNEALCTAMFAMMGNVFKFDPSGYWLMCPLSNFTE